GVDPAGVGRRGELLVPADPRRLGWWVGGAAPGDPGGTVLVAGHVDTAERGRGVLFGLERLAMGARVEVDTATGRLAYRVIARRSYRKTGLPRQLFDARQPHRLALVTCGGRFRDGAYDRNVIVYAEPVR
ncbi:MAG TPA: class F sortase, partial [Pilimelia sp.]|nr:class F sortase [Pilimelia sp.]